MIRYLPVAVAIAIISATGLLHGRMTDRWGKSTAVADAVARLDRVPTSIGGRVGQPVVLEGGALRKGGIDGYVARRFEDPRGGPAVSLLVVCGRPGPISLHTPDICYASAGYVQAGSAAKESAQVGTPAETAELMRAVFTKPSAVTSSDLQITWTWFDGRSWLAPDNPRMTFAPRGALYKLYVIRELASPSDAGPASPFEREALVTLQAALSQGR